ncbi:GIY-YIG nuclease superfamily protein [compost metagenome]
MENGQQDNRWMVYQLRCSDGTYFAGVTRDIAKSLARHQRGQVRKTQGALPVALVYCHETRMDGAPHLVRRLQFKPFNAIDGLPPNAVRQVLARLARDTLSP